MFISKVSLNLSLAGDQAMRDYKLATAPNGSFSVYDEATAQNPSVLNEFSTAAFRIGHSQVPGNFLYAMIDYTLYICIGSTLFHPFTRRLYDENDQENKDQSFSLSTYFNNAIRIMEPTYFDNALRGLTKQVPSQINSQYTFEMTRLLFKYIRLFTKLY